MALDADLNAWLRLALTQGLSGENFRKLLSAFGGPDKVLGASRSSLAQVAGGKVADAITEGVLFGTVDAVEDWLGDASNHIVTLANA